MPHEDRKARRQIRVDDDTWKKIAVLQARLKEERNKQVSSGELVKEALELLEARLDGKLHYD